MDAIAARTHTPVLSSTTTRGKEKVSLEVLGTCTARSDRQKTSSTSTTSRRGRDPAHRRITYNYYLEHRASCGWSWREPGGGRRLRKSGACARSIDRSSTRSDMSSSAVSGTCVPAGPRRGRDHKAIAALACSNVTNQHTFSAISGESGHEGDVVGRRAMVTD